MQPYFGREKFQLQYIDFDGIVISINRKDIIKDSKKLGDVFDFSNLDENQVLFSNKNKKTISNFKLETSKKNWLDAFVCLRSKAYTFMCNGGVSIKINGISKSHLKN